MDIVHEIPVSSCISVPAPVCHGEVVPEDTVDGFCCGLGEVEVTILALVGVPWVSPWMSFVNRTHLLQ